MNLRKQTLRYRTVENENSSLTGKRSVFHETTAKPRINSFKIHTWTCSHDYFTSKPVYGSNVLATGGTAVVLFTIKMANIWQIRGALYGAQWRVPTNFIQYIFTLMLVLLSYHRFISRSGPTSEKIAFHFRYVTLPTFWSLVEGILENS